MQRIGGLLERHVFLGQPDRALAEAREAARLIPSPWSYDNWVLLAILADRLVEAQSALAEADNKGFDTSRLRWNRDLVAFVRHDKAGLQEQWIRAQASDNADGLLYSKSVDQAYYGHLRSARATLRQMSSSRKAGPLFNHYRFHIALQDAEVGNASQAQVELGPLLNFAQTRDEQLNLALALARAGDVARARKLADVLDEAFPNNTMIQNFSHPTIRAAIKLQGKDPEGAIEILRPALNYDLAFLFGSFSWLYPAYIRGLAYLQLRDRPHAADEFQKLLDHQGLVGEGRSVIGALSHLQLARARRITGDEAAALKSYETF